MLNSLFKRRLSDEQLLNVFINGIFNAIDDGFDDVKALIMEDPSFESKPQIENVSDGPFTMIVLVGNIQMLRKSGELSNLEQLEKYIYTKLATIFEMEVEEFIKQFKTYEDLMNHLNHPSKVVLYGMSKAIFSEYKLNRYQEDYFKNINTPNPLFLQRLDEVLKNFIWNWSAFFKQYKVHA